MTNLVIDVFVFFKHDGNHGDLRFLCLKVHITKATFVRKLDSLDGPLECMKIKYQVITNSYEHKLVITNWYEQ